MLLLATTDTLQGVASSASKVTATVFGMELNGTTEVYKTLYQGQLAAAAAAIYTVPALNVAFVKAITLVNTDASNSMTFQLFRNGSAAANALTPTLTIPAGGMAVWMDGQGWSFYDSSGQLLQRPATSPILSAVLTADSANQTSTTEAIVSAVLTVPANYCTPGTTFEFDLFFSGAQGATANTTPGILFQVRWGGLAGVVICSVGTITPATLLAATGGYARGMVTIRTIGATGTAKGGIIVTDPRGTRVAAGDMASKVGKTGAPVTIDTTVAKDLVITCKTTVADASAITFGESGSSFLERP